MGTCKSNFLTEPKASPMRSKGCWICGIYSGTGLCYLACGGFRRAGCSLRCSHHRCHGAYAESASYLNGGDRFVHRRNDLAARADAEGFERQAKARDA